jgi:ribonuclease R
MPDPLEKQLMSILEAEDYQPVRRADLAQRLNLNPQDRKAFRNLVRALELDGKLILLKKNRIALPTHGQLVRGELFLHAQGFGFVNTEDPDLPDIFVPEPAMGTARHLDTVLVRVFAKANPDPQKTHEGQIERVVKRGIDRVTGLLVKKGNGAWLIPDDPKLQDVKVTGFANGLRFRKQHKALALLEEPPYPGAPLSGTVQEDLGAFDDPGVDMISVLRAYNLEEEFPESVIREAEAWTEVPEDEFSRRKDLREVVTFTIDPVDAKDFDDALSVEVLKNGNLRLGIHIADVSHFVPVGSAIDCEARNRGTSAYLADRVITMLPENLTNNLCSLRPHQDRLAHSVMVELDKRGHIHNYDTHKSVIHSNCRMHYQQAQDFFDSGANKGIPRDVQDALRRMRPLAKALRNKRFKEGSIYLDSAEVKCVLDEAGKVLRVEKRKQQEANQLIEECMLLANQVVAIILSKAKAPCLYRIHEEPSEEQWLKMNADLEAFGLDEAIEGREDINRVLSGELPDYLRYPVSLTILRNMKRAEYAAVRREHFGLGFEHYSHFTSPIRRYPDLVVHRILHALETCSAIPYTHEDMPGIAQDTTTREQNAEQAERVSIQVKMVQYYNDLLWKGETGPWPGVIAGIMPKGLLVEVTATLMRGLVPFEALAGDYFEVNASGTHAVGARTKRTFHIGQPAKVELVSVDLRLRRLNFSLVEEGEWKKGQPHKRTGRARTKGSGKNKGSGRSRRKASTKGETQARGKGEARAKGKGETQARGKGEARAKGTGEARAKGTGEARAKGKGEARAKGTGKGAGPRTRRRNP